MTVTAQERHFDLEPEQRAASCEGKRTYASHSEAEKRARNIRRTKRIVVVPYKCPHCRKFHIGDPR